MQAWIASIVGIVVLGVLIEIILPEGESRKYIRGVYGLIVVWVLVSPLPKLLQAVPSTGANSGDSQQSVQIDESWAQSIAQQRLESDRNSLQELLQKNNYGNVQAVLIPSDDDIYVIEHVRLDISADPNAQSHTQELRDLVRRRFPYAEVTIDG